MASHGALANALGALNAAHASPRALSRAARNSEVGRIAAYDRAMLTALSMPSSTLAEIAARNAAMSSARAAELVAASNKGLSPSMVARVDALLGLPSSDPRLGLLP